MRVLKTLAFLSMFSALALAGSGCGSDCATGGSSCPANNSGGGGTGGSGNPPSQQEINVATEFFTSSVGAAQDLQDTPPSSADCQAIVTQLNNDLNLTCDAFNGSTGTANFTAQFVCTGTAPNFTVTFAVSFDNCHQNDVNATVTGDANISFVYNSTTGATTTTATSTGVNIDGTVYSSSNFSADIPTPAANPACSGTLTYTGLSCSVSNDCSTCN